MPGSAYRFFETIADGVNPILTIIAIVVVVLEWRRRGPVGAVTIAAATALGLGCIYAIAAIDQRWRVWQQLGGDYSLHSAYAVSLGTSLVFWRRTWIVPLVAALLGYLTLIVLMGYHRMIDVALAGLLGALVTFPWHLGARRSASRPYNRSMEFEEVLAPLAGEFDIDVALEEWRWLISGTFRALVATALGDLFIVAADGAVHFLDTVMGTCEPVASSVDDWEQKLRDDEQFDQWFMPGFVEQLRETRVLGQGQCYSPLHPPILGGGYTVENWPAISWQVHFSHAGRMHYAIKDLPDGADITKWNFTEL